MSGYGERQISSDLIRSVLVTPSELGRITYDYLHRASSGLIIGYKFGLPNLDKLVAGGIKPGEMVVIGARPGSGKSFMIHHIAEWNATHGIPTLVVSAEMTAEQIGVREFSHYTRIDSRDLYSGNVPVDGDGWVKISDAAGRQETVPLYLLAHRGTAEKERIVRPRFTIGLVDAAVEYLMSTGVHVKVVLIDYLQRMRSDLGRTQRKDIADEISGGAKDLALKYSCGLVIASQLGRQVDTRVPPLPAESDYKESGNIEEDADVSMSIFYPMKYYQEGDQIDGTERRAAKNQVFVQIHKQRGGESNTGNWFYFDPRFALLADLEERLAIDDF